jgi:predicted kinase
MALMGLNGLFKSIKRLLRVGASFSTGTRGLGRSQPTRFAALLSIITFPVVTIALVFVTAFSLSPSVASAGEVEGADHIDPAYHGTYTNARVAWHERILGDLLREGAIGRPPRLIFTSGPFGVGKTTLLKAMDQSGLIALDQFLVIDMDDIRKRLPEFIHYVRENPDTAAGRLQKEAGYLTEILLWRAIARGKNVIIDSSLGNSEFFQSLIGRILNEAPAYRGHVSLIHASAQLKTIQARVVERNRRDLRVTPEADVRASFIRDQQAFPVLRKIFDSVIEFDTSFDEPRVLAVKGDGRDVTGLSLTLTEAAERLGSLQATTPIIDSFTRLAADASLGLRPPNRGYDVVIDLDWTMFYTLDKPNSLPREEVIEWRTEKGVESYRASDHAAWLIEALISEPGVRVSFFSGGEKMRNEFLLRSLKLSDGRSAYDVASHIFNREDFTPISDDPSLPFDIRSKKRLQGLLRRFDLTRVLMLDDQPRFATAGAKAVHAHGEHRYRPFFDASLVGRPYEAPSAAAYRRELNKLLIFYGIFSEALRADREGRAEFASYAEAQAKDARTGEWLPLMSPELNRYFSIGASARRNSPTPLRSRSGTVAFPQWAPTPQRTCHALFAS